MLVAVHWLNRFLTGTAGGSAPESSRRLGGAERGLHARQRACIESEP